MRLGELDSNQLAVVLIAHGSRNAEANADAFYFAKQLQELGIARWVEAAFLELAEPSIPAALVLCLSAKPRAVVLLPYFLSAGVHVRRDLGSMCRELGEAHPEVQFILAEPLGRHPLIVDVLEERVRQSLS
jgi:sirohydrochlorin ferrochelatase